MASKDAEDLAKIDPEFEAYLKTLPAVPRLRGDIPTLRKQLADVKRRMNEASGVTPIAPEDISEQDITVTARDGFEVPVRIYRPKFPPPSECPLIVFYHGGGFCLGDLSNEELNCRNFCREFGALCVNVDYRLGPEHKFPTAIYDSWDVLVWAAQSASSLGADPSKGFLIYGTSAGASIAIIISHLARDRSLSPPLTGTGLSIPVAFDVRNPPNEYANHLLAYRQNVDAPILDMLIMEQFLDDYGYDPSSKLYSPFAGPKEEWNFKDLPPAAIWACGMDPLRDDAVVYDRVLRENGTKTRFKMYKGLLHSFWSFAPTLESSEAALRDFVDGVSWLLGQK